MTHKFWVFGAALMALSACTSPDDEAQSAAPADDVTTSAPMGKVEITLAAMLDGVTSSYCLDIAGGNKNIDITKGLQAHTCYSYRGDLGTDQTFETSRFANNELYMPDFDVCATAKSLKAGAAIGLASCDGSDLQKMSFSGNGSISMIASPELCFTAAEKSRFGKSEIHQIKKLSLQPCSADLAPYQTWRGRATAD